MNSMTHNIKMFQSTFLRTARFFNTHTSAVLSTQSPFIASDKNITLKRYVGTANKTPTRTSNSSLEWHRNIEGIMIPIEDKRGALMDVLRICEKHGINMTSIQNFPAPLTFRQTLLLHFEGRWDDPPTQLFISDINAFVGTGMKRVTTPEVPWFPTKLSDIDRFSQSVLDANIDLESDHPGFKDEEYRKRRVEISDIASTYKSGMSVPRIEYTQRENDTWAQVYEKLTELYPTMACKEYNYALRNLLDAGVFSPYKIPQLEDVSKHLKSKTGFTLRPVKGLLSGRDFLNALAFRVFFSTQYIRHHSVPLYTPEPDVVHELMGHAPMFCIEEFAELSQLIGLASLGATDEQIKRLASAYWFSIEYGVLMQEGAVKAFGAGLLSSFGELQYATSPTNNSIQIRYFDPFEASEQEYPITEYQPVLYAAKGFEDAKQQMIAFCQKLQKPFCVQFDSANQCIRTDKCVNPKAVSIKF